LISVTNSKDGTPFSQYTYSYDNNGNITSVTDLNGTTSYEYDVLNRLIEVIKGGATTQEYTYDARGNRENQTGVTAETNGNETLSYNLWNQLVSVADSTGTTTFEYGPTSLRVKKGSKNYIYDVNGNLKAEADASNNITATYIWGGNRLLVKKLADGTQYYYLYNGHGDVVQITDNAGNIVNSYEYDEWGNITSQTETIANEFKYAGQIYDSETGLYYLRARYYDPTTGRFISKDSNEGNIVNPLSLNLYTYCENNPVNYVDPTGHITVNNCVYLYNMKFYDADPGNREWARVQIEQLSVPEQIKLVLVIRYIRAKQNYVDTAIENLGPYAAQAAADAFDVSMGYLAGEAVGGIATLSKGAGKTDILSGKTLTNQTGKVNNYVSEVKGNAAAQADFYAKNPSNVRTYSNGTVVGDLPDGTTINMHPSTSLGGTPTVEIYNPNTGISTKIRY